VSRRTATLCLPIKRNQMTLWVVACWARRHLADTGRAMAARSRRLAREASLISRADAAGGMEATAIADHGCRSR
jgi:hypothetical protein